MHASNLRNHDQPARTAISRLFSRDDSPVGEKAPKAEIGKPDWEEPSPNGAKMSDRNFTLSNRLHGFRRKKGQSGGAAP